MSRSLGSVGVVLAWLAAVVAATLVGVLAVGAIGSGILPEGQSPLSQAEVSRQLAAPEPTRSPGSSPTTSPTRTPTGQPTDSPTSNPSTPAAGQLRALPSRGGTIFARCNPAAENGIEVKSVAPAQGYHSRGDESEDNGRRVRFESGDSRIEVQIECAAGVPHIVSEDDDHSGRGSGDDD